VVNLDSPVPVGGVLFHHLENLALELLISSADLGSLVPVPGGLGHRKGRKISVQPVLLAVLFHQLQVSLQGQHSYKKPVTRNASPILSPNTSTLRSRSFRKCLFQLASAGVRRRPRRDRAPKKVDIFLGPPGPQPPCLQGFQYHLELECQTVPDSALFHLAPSPAKPLMFASSLGTPGGSALEAHFAHTLSPMSLSGV